MQRAHTQRAVNLHGRLHRLGRGAHAAHHFDQGQQIHGIEGVADHAALGVLGIGIKVGGQQARRAGADQYILPRRSGDLRVQRQFEILPFRRAFLDEVSMRHAFLDRGDKLHAVLRSAGRQALGGQRTPGLGGARAQRGFGAGGRVPGDHVQAVGQRTRHPAAADHAGAKRRESFDVGHKRHSAPLFIRVSSGPWPRGLRQGSWACCPGG